MVRACGTVQGGGGWSAQESACEEWPRSSVQESARENCVVKLCRRLHVCLSQQAGEQAPVV